MAPFRVICQQLFILSALASVLLGVPAAAFYFGGLENGAMATGMVAAGFFALAYGDRC